MLHTFADGQLFGNRHGDGQPRVLGLHGWGRSNNDLTAVLDAFDAVALDLPGFGAAPEPPEAWSTERYAQAISPILDEMAQHVVVVGHSFGGRIGLHLAATRPDRVGGLVLSGVPGLAPTTAGRPSRPPWAYRAARWANRVGVLSDARMERRRLRRGSADYRAASEVMRQVLVMAVNERYDHLLPLIECPTELVWGEADTAAPVADARAAVALIPMASLEVLTGIDHYTTSAAPEHLTAAIGRCIGVLGSDQ